MKKLAEYFAESEQGSKRPVVGDTVDIHINEELAIEAGVLESTEDKLVLEYDERGISLLEALDLVEGFNPDSFEGENDDFGLGTLRYKAMVDDNGRVQVIHDSITVETGGPNSPEEFRELSDEDQIYALEAAQEHAEETWNERDDKYAHGESIENESALIAVDKMPKRSQAEAMADADEKFMSLLNKLLGKEPKTITTKPKDDNIVDKLRDKMSRGSTIPGVKKEEAMAEDGDEKFTDKEIKMAFGILNDPRFKSGNMTEIVRRIEGIADGLSDHPSVRKALQRTNEDITNEAEYQGRKVKLGKPMRGDVAKYKVYVKDPKTGNIKKVNFGDKNMEIKRDDPKRRKSFRARHGCGTSKASDRTKARYWSCRMWSKKPVSKIV